MLTLLGIICVGVMIVLASNYKLFKRVKGWYYRQTNDAANLFGTIVDDAKDNLKAAEVETKDFRNQIAELMAANEKLDNEHKKSVAEAEKWLTIAKEAAAAKNQEHVKAAVEKKQAAEKYGITLATNVAQNEKLIQKLRNQLDSRVNEIKTAKTDVVTNEVRFTSLRMRERMLNASNAFGGGSLDSLTKTKEDLDDYERKLNAMDELGGEEAVELEKIYRVDTKVDDEVQRLMFAK